MTKRKVLPAPKAPDSTSKIRVRKGVKAIAIRPELLLAIMVADGIYLKKGKNLVITSINEGKHSLNSFHYSGAGVDLRTRYFTKKEKLEVFKELKENLTEDYFVKLEKTHIHVQYQQRR